MRTWKLQGTKNLSGGKGMKTESKAKRRIEIRRIS